MDTLRTPSPRLPTLTGYYGFVLIGWNSVLIPSLIRSVEHDFHQSDAAFGLFFLLGALVYGLAAFGGGLLTERLGRRLVLRAAALSLAAGLVAEALAPTWAALLLASLPVNWGAAAIDSGMNGLVLDLYRDTRGGALNLLHVFFGLGGLAAPFAAGQLVTAGVPWRANLLGLAAAALPLLALLSVATLPSGRHERHERRAAQPERAAPAGAEASLRPFAGLALSIGLYVAAELAVSNWLVRFLAGTPVATATAILSLVWAGITLGRLGSRWLAERVDYYAFTIGCVALASAALLGAVLAPWLALSAVLFGLSGVFFGPIYPMIMALGGNIYPRRLAALSGGLAASAVAGGMIYPPLMGLLAARVGLRDGMIGAALLGLPSVLCLLGVRAAAGRRHGAAAPRQAAGRAR